MLAFEARVRDLVLVTNVGVRGMCWGPSACQECWRLRHVLGTQCLSRMLVLEACVGDLVLVKNAGVRGMCWGPSACHECWRKRHMLGT